MTVPEESVMVKAATDGQDSPGFRSRGSWERARSWGRRWADVTRGFAHRLAFEEVGGDKHPRPAFLGR